MVRITRFQFHPKNAPLRKWVFSPVTKIPIYRCPKMEILVPLVSTRERSLRNPCGVHPHIAKRGKTQNHTALALFGTDDFFMEQQIDIYWWNTNHKNQSQQDPWFLGNLLYIDFPWMCFGHFGIRRIPGYVSLTTGPFWGDQTGRLVAIYKLPIDVWYIYIYIPTFNWSLLGKLVGKYTIPTDPIFHQKLNGTWTQRTPFSKLLELLYTQVRGSVKRGSCWWFLGCMGIGT